jgi:hypothetical protein
MNKIPILALFASLWACSPQQKGPVANPQTIQTNTAGSGELITVHFTAGQTHNHPLMAIWAEDTAGNYLQTLYVAKSIATGVFGHASATSGHWEPGAIRRPAALPYWSHKRNVPATDGLFTPDAATAVPDAYSGATPALSFDLNTRTNNPITGTFCVLLEVNQSWDWNAHWHNNKYPGNAAYATSSQPSVVYKATLNLAAPGQKVSMVPIGHGHPAGSNGQLFTDLSTLTTALQIASNIEVTIAAP